MVTLSNHIAKGYGFWLLVEVLGIFSVITASLLAWSGTLVETSTPFIAISFIIGAVFYCRLFWNEHCDQTNVRHFRPLEQFV